jgi:hypothetical protein
MTLGNLGRNDIVLVEPKQGGRFFALVRDVDGRQIRMRPITKGISRYTCTSNEVIGIWRANKATAAHPERIP